MLSSKNCTRKRALTMKAASSSEILRNLKSDDNVFQIWAVNQLPPVGQIGASRTTATSFEYINAIILSKDYEFQKAVQQAIARELRHKVMSSEERIRVLLPFLIKMCRSTDEKEWMELLRQLSRTIVDPVQQSLAFDQLSPIFLLDHSHSGTKCAIQMLTGLCEAGATMPAELINNVLQQPIVLQQFLPQFLNCLLTTQSDKFIDNVLEKIVQSPISQQALFNAAIQLDSIPDILLRGVKGILRLPKHSHELAATIAKNYQFIVAKELAKPKTLLQIVWKSKLFTSKYYDVIADFFLATLEVMSAKDSVLFFKKIVNSKSPRANWLVKDILKNSSSSVVTSYVIPYLCSENAYKDLDSWINAVSSALPLVNSNDATKLTEFIIQACKEEITYGHISTLPIDPQVIQDTNIKGPIVIKVSGSKQIAQLLKTLELTPCMHILASEGIELIKLALTKFTYPLVDSIGGILRKLTTKSEEVLEFLNFLFEQNSTYKMVFIKLIPGIIHSLDRKVLLDNVLPMILDLFNDDIPINVICAAIKLIPTINGFSTLIAPTLFYKEMYNILKELREDKDPAIIDAMKDVKKDITAFLKIKEILVANQTVKRRKSLPKENVSKENRTPNIKRTQKRISLISKNPKPLTGIIKPEKFNSSSRRMFVSSALE